jgi:microsomal dipeptidase-like Zn-dependent dipeptidase
MEQPRSFFDWIFSSQGTIPAENVASTPEPYRHLRGFENPADWANVAEGLLARNYSEVDTRKILGENWLKLFDRAWQ